MTLSARISEVLSIDPAAPAVEFEGEWHSWGELASAGAAVGEAAERAGVAPSGPVGVLMQNRPEVVAALAGVVVAERCLVTLSPHHGGERLARELAELRLPLVVACEAAWTDALREACAAAGSVGVAVDRGSVREVVIPEAGAGGAAARRGPLPGVAVEMLTSGTTGPPKRIALRRSAIEHALLGSKHYERGGAANEGAAKLRRGVAVLSAPLVHVAGIFRSLQCLCDGRAFALMDRFAVDAFCELVERHRPATVSLVPAALRAVLDADVPKAVFESVRAVVSGTAPLPVETAVAFEEKYGVPVLVSYGATEFAGGVAGWTLALHREFAAHKRGSVGRAHPGCELRVVDREGGDELAAGERGLLEVRTAQASEADGNGGWVRTTDLAEIDADGFLFIRGRADAAILRGGFKVMPDAVARALEEHPAVREAAVVGLPDERLGERPVAAVQLVESLEGQGDARRPQPEELLAFARERLARYEVPSELVIVDELPRTPSLKVSQPMVRELFAKGPSGS